MKATSVSWGMALIQVLNLLLLLGVGYLVCLLVKALRKYLRASDVRREITAARKSLGELLREQRTRCRMTQEFVAEQLGVSRQAVSKWESGASDPSTSNLLALAKLFRVDAAELLHSRKDEKQ